MSARSDASHSTLHLKCNASNTAKMSDEDFGDDDLFDGVDADEILQSSQAPIKHNNKRGSHDSDAHDAQPSSKRAKTEPYDPSHDAENTALARRLLKEKFGYDAFRHEQEGAIKRVLAGKNSLVIFPTGAGKSLCYQVSFHETAVSNGL